MKARLLSGYGIRPQDKSEQVSLDVEIKTERTGMSLGTDRQLIIFANGSEFMRLEFTEREELRVTVTPMDTISSLFTFPEGEQTVVDTSGLGGKVYVNLD